MSRATAVGNATRRRHAGVRRPVHREIAEMQRMRLLDAAIDAVEDVGYARMTVAEVISRARVSRKTFYEIFGDREQCLLAAFEHVLTQMRELAEQAYQGQPSWRDGVRSALAALLDFMDEQPGLARLCIVEVLTAGDSVCERRAEILGELAHAIDLGRAAGRHDPHGLTAEGVVGGVLAIVYRRLSAAEPEPLRPLLGALMYMIVLPYLGANTACAELDADRVKFQAPRRPVHTRAKHPSEGLKMRLTYRTMRVLSVIAAHPGASNRDVSLSAGVVDQGQISKLLNRLARLGLIENNGAGQPLGAANAWQLTDRGEQLERATRRR